MSENRIFADRTTRAPGRDAPGPAGDGQMGAPACFSFVIVPRFNLATLITMIEPLRIANYLAPAALYRWEILSLDGDQVAASNGLTMQAHPPEDRNRRGDTVFVLASWGAETYDNRDLLAWVRRQARAGVRVCAVELGCYILARAGLLTGKQVATHWSWAPGFQERFSDIAVVEQLYTSDPQGMTCAGGLAGTDLMLTLIRDAHGEAFAGEVADQMLHHPVRPAEAPQRRAMGQGVDRLPDLVRRAIDLIEQNMAEPLPVPGIAAALGISQRQLERQFRDTIGCTVVQFGTLCRLQHARVLLISTAMGVREISAATGFNSLSHFAYAFGRCFGRRPSDYRQAWPSEDPTPSWPGTLALFVGTLQQKAKNGPQHGGHGLDASGKGPAEPPL